MSNRVLGSIAFGLLLSTACISGKNASLARSGELRSLKAVILDKQKSGTLSNAEARAIAVATVTHELATESKEERKRRVSEVSSCAREVADALRDLGKTHDEVGALAVEILLDTNIETSWSASATETDGGWRAIWARSLTRDKDGDARRAAIVDADARVRRSALRAAIIANDINDAGLVLERARLDPDPFARTQAVRTLIAIGTETQVAQLHDLYASGDEPLQTMIATAWATTVLAHGGERELKSLFTDTHAAVEPTAMAGVFYIRGSAPSGELKDLSTAAVVRALSQGTTEQKKSMARLVPLSPEFLPLLKDAAKGSDRELSVVAWGRLLSVPDQHEGAKTALRTYAGNDLGRISSSAREMLANDGDTQIQAWIERDLSSPDVQTNLSAVRALGAIHRVSRAAPLLVSESATVRNRAACAMLASSR